MMLERIKEIYCNNMDGIGLRYLSNRGIDELTVLAYELGLHTPGILSSALTAQEIKDYKRVSNSLFYDNIQGELDRETRIVYPLYKYVVNSWQLVGFHSRSIDPDSKLPHRGLTNLSYSLFNEPVAASNSIIIVAEGQNDALILIQAGFPALGLLGAGRFSLDNAETLKSHGVKEAIMIFDTDENQSGVKGARKTADILSAVGIKAKISLLPALEAKKTDITDLYLNNPDSFKAVILNIIKDAKLHIPGRKHRSEPISHKVSKILGIMRLSDLYDFNSSRQKFQIKCVFPDHNDTQASMSIDLTKNVFYCHGDGRGGGPLQFLMYLKGLTKSEAVKLIEMRFKK